MISHLLCSICYTKRGVWPVFDFCSEADEEFAKRIELDRVGRIQENVPKENTLELANSFQGGALCQGVYYGVPFSLAIDGK